nr:uncharacterized protein LOC129278644 [Lytechinus pictus]
MDTWAKLGKEAGLEGVDLINFVKEREASAREERVQMLELKRNEIKILELKQQLEETKTNAEFAENFIAQSAPKLSPFNEDGDDFDSYLVRFEKYATLQGWPTSSWAMNLSALLTGKSLQVYARLNSDEAQSYPKVREALCKRFNLTEEGFRGKFRNARPEKDENPSQFMERLSCLLDRWLTLANVETSLDLMKTLIIREQYLSKCSPDLLVFLKERGLTNLKDLGQVTEQYVEARQMSFFQVYQGEKKPGSASQGRPAMGAPGKVQGQQPRSLSVPQNRRLPRTCYLCKKVGHFANECRFRSSALRASCMQEVTESLEPKGEVHDDGPGEMITDKSDSTFDTDNADQDPATFCPC